MRQLRFSCGPSVVSIGIKVGLSLTLALPVIADQPLVQQGTQLVDSVERQAWDDVRSAIQMKSQVQVTQADGMTALHWAVFHDQADVVRQLVKAGADVNAATDYRITPLAITCTNGNARIGKMLLNAGADATAELAGGETLLMTASRVGNATLVQDLIDHGAKVDAKDRKGQTALMWASAAGNRDAVDHLLRAGADFDETVKSGFSAMMFAARHGHIDVVSRLLKAGVDVNAVMKPSNTSGRAPRDRMSALMLAVESGHFELAIELIKSGADPNDQRSGYAPLHALSWVRKASRGDGVDGDPEPRGSGGIHSLQFVREVVAAGADVNLQIRKSGGGKAKLNKGGATPFLFASKTADLPLLELLHELGADPTIANDDGCTPLMAAAGIGVTAVGEEAGTEPEVLETVKWLHRLGADPNAVDKNKETAIHGSAYRSYPKVAILLAELGADPKVWNHKNKHGWSPRLIAQGHRPGSFKPSPEMIVAIDEAMRIGGMEPVVNESDVERESEYAKKPTAK